PVLPALPALPPVAPPPPVLPATSEPAEPSSPATTSSVDPSPAAFALDRARRPLPAAASVPLLLGVRMVNVASRHSRITRIAAVQAPAAPLALAEVVVLTAETPSDSAVEPAVEEVPLDAQVDRRPEER